MPEVRRKVAALLLVPGAVAVQILAGMVIGMILLAIAHGRIGR